MPMAGTAIEEGVLDLPPEITENVLARLPVKSLLRFWCVSKSWYSLISSPQFIKFHLKIAKEDSTLSGHRILLCDAVQPFHKYCSIPSLIDGRPTDASDLHDPDIIVDPWYVGYQVVGYCNGLFCINPRNLDVFLWNPSIRFSNRLPPVRIDLNYAYTTSFGFGYSETSDDYKVLVFIETFQDLDSYLSAINVYSLRDNYWKTIDGLETGYCLCNQPRMFANGKLYFAVETRNLRKGIASFDFNSDNCAIVEQPNLDDDYTELLLGVSGECICVLCRYGDIRADLLWILKEYGGKELWVKVAAIPNDFVPMDIFRILTLFVLPSGKILLAYEEHEAHIIVYDPNDGSSRRFHIGNINILADTEVYVESLVSPAAYDNEGML